MNIQRRHRAGEVPAPEEYVERLSKCGVPDFITTVYAKFGWYPPPERNSPSCVLLAASIALEHGIWTPKEAISRLVRWADAGDPKPTYDQVVGDATALNGSPPGCLGTLVEQRLRDERHDVVKALGKVETREFESFRSLLLRKGGTGIKVLQGVLGEVPGGRFVAEHFHKEGGFGYLFKGRDRELGREVCLKELKEQYAYDPANCERFHQEARVASHLEHPGIIPIYGIGSHPDGRPYYVMRFLKGGTLEDEIQNYHSASAGPRRTWIRRLLERRGKGESDLALRRLLERFRDVCNAVAFANSRGVLHRDIKPKNIVLGEYDKPGKFGEKGEFGETIIADWGLAKMLGEPDSEWLIGTQLARKMVIRETLHYTPGEYLDQTEDGNIKGTLSYMSPEQASGDIRRLTFASDVYSLGAMLYYILVGIRAFEFGGTQTRVNVLTRNWLGQSSQVTTRKSRRGGQDAIIIELLGRIKRGDFKRPREVNPRVPRALEEVCLKAMALIPEQRYVTAKDLADDVENWLADEPVKAWHEPVMVKARRWAGRHRLLATSAIIAVIAALATISVTRIYNNANGLVEVLNRCDVSAIPEIVKQLRGRLWLVRGRLEEQRKESDAARRLRAALALAPVDASQTEFLLAKLGDDTKEIDEIRSILDVLMFSSNDRPEELTSLVQYATPEEIRQIIARIREIHAERRASAILQSMLGGLNGGGIEGDDRRARVAAATLLLDPTKAGSWPFAAAKDLSLRTELIRILPEVLVDARPLIDRQKDEPDPSIRQGMILALGGFPLDSASKEALAGSLVASYRHEADVGLHSAIDWLLGTWNMGKMLRDIDQELKTRGRLEKYGWYVNKVGMTMAVIPGTKEPVKLGSPEDEESRQVDETPHDVRLAPFELATREITVELFFQFLDSPLSSDLNRAKIRERVTRYSNALGNYPAVGVTWYEAARFCNWLSDREHLQRCYEDYAPAKNEEQYVFDLKFRPGRNGYRLPDEDEWEYACRAGTVTPWLFGRKSEDILGDYAWYVGNVELDGHKNSKNDRRTAGQQTQPVGLKKPNNWGLFDMLGNASEWTQNLYEPDGMSDSPGGLINKTNDRVLRGGAFDRDESDLRSAYRDRDSPSRTKPVSTNGFRPARSR